jgi:hypothetical protein
MSATARDALWAKLRGQGLVEGELPAPGETRAPWFVRLMLGIAGWIGAFFLLGFVGAAFAFVLQSSAASFVAGACACAAAVVIFRAAPRNDFIAQFGLAVSLAGQVLLVMAVGKWFSGPSVVVGVALYIALQQALLFVLAPNYLHRVWAAWSGALAAAYALVDMGLYAFVPALMTAAFVGVALREFDLARYGAIARAGVYGLALAAMQAAVMHGGLSGVLIGLRGDHGLSLGEAGIWLGRLASLAVLLWAVVELLRREGLALSSGQGRVGLAGALILGAASIKAPGVAPTVAILIVGYANTDRALTGLDSFALLGYLSHYYYSLQTTLLEKSALLAAAGVALLAARLAMRSWWPAPKGGETGHA